MYEMRMRVDRFYGSFCSVQTAVGNGCNLGMQLGNAG